jgi:hypothetical protein
MVHLHAVRYRTIEVCPDQPLGHDRAKTTIGLKSESQVTLAPDVLRATCGTANKATVFTILCRQIRPAPSIDRAPEASKERAY